MYSKRGKKQNYDFFLFEVIKGNIIHFIKTKKNFNKFNFKK